MPRVLLIDDETAARADLRAKLAVHAGVEIVGEAATLRSARTLLTQPGYDLVFLDIQLVGGSSFELVPDVHPGADIVFVTAHDRYALRAFEINARDYVLKPVAPARLAEALRRVAAPSVRAEKDADEISRGRALGIDDRVYLRAGLRARFAPVAEISIIAARDNYSEVHLADGSRVFLRKSLTEWEETLPVTYFMRVHRTQIVNLTRVTRYQRDRDERTLLFVDGSSEPVAASRYRWSELRSRLEQLHAAR